MSQLRYLTFYTVAGGEQTVKLQDYASEERVEMWAPADTALSGRKRQNVKGMRGQYRLSYRQSLEPAVYRSVYNNIVSDLTGGRESITISEGQDLSQARVVVATDAFLHAVQYASQIGEFVPSMEFMDQEISRLTGRYVAEGYVDEGYVE